MFRLLSLFKHKGFPLPAIVALVLLLSFSGASETSAAAAHVRWDIISLHAGSVSEGGIASALANNGAKITLTGNGTFVAPAGGRGSSAAATGGGTWETFGATGASTGTGTYEVTGLVRWDIAPGVSPPVTDLIGDPAERHGGLAILTVAYSDGERGVLVVSCDFVGTPDTVFEGITASKSFADYFNRVAPAAGVDANRTLFHAP